MRLLKPLIVAASFISIPTEAALVTASCDDPSGYHVYHGPEPSRGPEIHHEEGPAKKFGSKPAFILDDRRPSEIIVLWGSTISPHLSPKLIDELNLRAKAETGTIIRRTPSEVIAIQKYENGVYMYSLYLKLGYGIFTKHSTWTNGKATAWLYYGSCRFKEG
ncbi:hypothetical protein ES702_06565 [subsurface metagenome]